MVVIKIEKYECYHFWTVAHKDRDHGKLAELGGQVGEQCLRQRIGKHRLYLCLSLVYPAMAVERGKALAPHPIFDSDMVILSEYLGRRLESAPCFPDTNLAKLIH